LHRGDLGDYVTGVSVVHLTGGHQIAVPPWCSRYFSCPPTSSGPRHT
jgi:hypothetical protein